MTSLSAPGQIRFEIRESDYPKNSSARLFLDNGLEDLQYRMRHGWPSVNADLFIRRADEKELKTLRKQYRLPEELTGDVIEMRLQLDDKEVKTYAARERMGTLPNPWNTFLLKAVYQVVNLAQQIREQDAYKALLEKSARKEADKAADSKPVKK